MNCVNCGHCVCSHRAKKLVASAAKCQCPDRKDERPCQLGSGAAGRKDAGEWGTWEKRMCFSGYNAADTHNFTAGAYRRQNLNHCVASSAFCYNLRFMGDILQFTLSQKHFATDRKLFRATLSRPHSHKPENTARSSPKDFIFECDNSCGYFPEAIQIQTQTHWRFIWQTAD
uniref:HDC16023 n=1 Tax=Drosophila melanogaster TaxID=7227 RepID=Q6IJ40_DROME|nr:TPA_inf: HDC16023 [Drosophila melanogaster]